MQKHVCYTKHVWELLFLNTVDRLAEGCPVLGGLDFLFQFFLSHYFRNQLTTSKTATINQITTKMLDGIRLNVPSLEQQQAFAEKVKAIEQQKQLINQSIKDVQTLFDAKMDYYFGD
jgi:restriction endonuclease S subunit